MDCPGFCELRGWIIEDLFSLSQRAYPGSSLWSPSKEDQVSTAHWEPKDLSHKACGATSPWPHLGRPCSRCQRRWPLNMCMLATAERSMADFQMSLFLNRFVNISSVKLITMELFLERLQENKKQLYSSQWTLSQMEAGQNNSVFWIH